MESKEQSRTNNKPDFHPESLCFKCGNCVDGCSWSRTFTPVDGWKAEPNYINSDEAESYHVVECPQYKPDAARNIEKIHEDGFKPLLYAMLNSMVRDYANAYIKLQANPDADKALLLDGTLKEIESFVKQPMFEDIVDVLEIMADGPKLLELIRRDPQGVIDRLDFDPDNLHGKRARAYREAKLKRKELNHAY